MQEFFPTVSLGDPTLESLLNQHGLKVRHCAVATPRSWPRGSPDTPLPLAPQDKMSLKRSADAFLPWLLQSLRQLSHPFSGPAILWSLYLVVATVYLLRALGRRPRGGAPPARHKGPRRGDPADRGVGEKNGQVRRKEAKEAEEKGEGRTRGAADGHSDGLRGTKKKK